MDWADGVLLICGFGSDAYGLFLALGWRGGLDPDRRRKFLRLCVTWRHRGWCRAVLGLGGTSVVDSRGDNPRQVASSQRAIPILTERGYQVAQGATPPSERCGC